MNNIQDWKDEINRQKIAPFEKERLLGFADLFEANKFTEAHDLYIRLDEFLRGCIPEAYIREIESEIY